MRLLLTLLFLTGCATLGDDLLEGNYRDTFKTNLESDVFYECLNANQPKIALIKTPIEMPYVWIKQDWINNSVMFKTINDAFAFILLEEGTVEMYIDPNNPFGDIYIAVSYTHLTLPTILLV